MSDSSSPKAEYAKEVRFAVVMYGGVSLAIYMPIPMLIGLGLLAYYSWVHPKLFLEQRC